jgi:uncharacterized protein YigA (DUF484 family)
VTGGRDVPCQAGDAPAGDVGGSYRIFGDEAANWIKSEALMKPRPRCQVVGFRACSIMGAEDPHQFRPTQGTDLLTFFAGVFERLMRRWLG